MIDLKPLRILIDKHRLHKDKYTANFRGLDFIIYPETLNPNYTKVSGFLSDNVKVPQGAKVLDMFCGTGAIGIVNSKNAESVLEVDVSEAAIKCVEENIKSLNLETKISSRVSDLWQNIQDGEKFDVIIANPPLLPLLPTTEFEKNLADSENMDLTVKFIEGCPKHLNLGGIVYIATSTASNISPDKSKDGDIAVRVGLSVGLKSEVVAELNAGYEIYRVIKLIYTND